MRIKKASRADRTKSVPCKGGEIVDWADMNSSIVGMPALLLCMPHNSL